MPALKHARPGPPMASVVHFTHPMRLVRPFAAVDRARNERRAARCSTVPLGQPTTVETATATVVVDSDICFGSTQRVAPLAVRLLRALRRAVATLHLPVLRAEPEGDIRALTGIHTAQGIRGPSVAGPSSADILSVIHGTQMSRIHTPPMEARRTPRAVRRHMAGVVQHRFFGYLAVGLPVGESVRGRVVPHAVSVDADGSLPQPARFGAARPVHEGPEVLREVSCVGEGTSRRRERVAVPLVPRVVLAAHAFADRARAALLTVFHDLAWRVPSGSGADGQRVSGALPADVVLLAPAARDGGAGASGSVLSDGTGSVGHGRTPSRQGFGRGRRWLHHRRPTSATPQFTGVPGLLGVK